TGERLARSEPEALEHDAPPGRLEGEGRASVPLAGRLELDLGGERLLQVSPGEPAARLDGGDDDETFPAGPAEQSRCVGPNDLPPGTLGAPPPVGPDGHVTRPPVREMVRLGEELPDIAARRQELPLRLDSHRPRLSRFRHEALPTRALFLNRVELGRRLGEPLSSSFARSAHGLQELLAAEHSAKLLLPLGLPQVLDPRVRRITRDLPDAEVP